MRVPYFLLHRIPNIYTVHESAVRLGPQPAYPFAPRNHSRAIFGNAESSLVPPFRSSPGTTSNTSEGATRPACSCTGRPEPQRQRAGRSGPGLPLGGGAASALRPTPSDGRDAGASTSTSTVERGVRGAAAVLRKRATAVHVHSSAPKPPKCTVTPRHNRSNKRRIRPTSYSAF